VRYDIPVRAMAAGLALGLLLTPLAVAPAGAQEVDGAVTIKLLGQPVAAAPDDRLGLELRVSNGTDAPLDGFVLSIAAYGAVESRSELHTTFGSLPAEAVASSYSNDDHADERVLPGETVDVVVDDPIATLVSLRDETVSGVYPLTVTLLSSDGIAVLDSLTTFLLYYPAAPDVPLTFVLVVPVNGVPAEGPDGVFRPDANGLWPLEDALARDGWLSALTGALDRWAGGRGAHLGLAPTPRLVEEVAHLADGFRRGDGDEVVDVPASDAVPKAAAEILDRLREILGRRGVQPLLTPYSFPDLPALARGSDELLVQEQVQVGQNVINELLEADVQPRWLFPSAGRLDPLSLRQLALNRSARRTFFSEGALEEAADPAQSGCPGANLTLTFACPVAVPNPSTGAEVVGYQADQAVQERLAALAQGGDSRLDLQELFAETAMIHAELPGQPERVVHATVPSLWHPSKRLISSLLRGLARAPWLETATPSRGLRLAAPPEPRRLRQALPPLQNDPGEALLAAIQEAGDSVESFATINPPEGLIQRLRRAVLTAQSRTWWTDPALTARGADYATAAEDAAMAELGKISVVAAEQVTMTSREAEIPLAVYNDTLYPVRIRIHLVSPNLTFESDTIEAIFEPGGDRLPRAVSATARTSGIFTLTINAETPDGRITFGTTDVTIRSTEFNRIALGLTLGALVFLIAFYAAKAVRRKRGGAGESDGRATGAGA
jgi:hypothetical protein